MNIEEDDIFDTDPTPIVNGHTTEHVEPFADFKDLIDPVKLRTKLEIGNIDSKVENGKVNYRVIISEARMNAIREFAEKKCDKFPGGRANTYSSAVKGAMGETAIVIILREFLSIFGLDPRLAKVNLRIHPGNDGGKDHLIGGIRINSKFSNSPRSGIFFSERDLDNKDDSDYYVLVNGEGLTDSILKDSKYGSYPVTISGVVKSDAIIKSDMTSIKNREGRCRWVIERNDLKSMNLMIRNILDNLNVKGDVQSDDN
jgi:hypothetical protein